MAAPALGAFLSGDKLSIPGIQWRAGCIASQHPPASQLLCIDGRDARYENPIRSSPLSHLVMPNPNEIISLSPAQLVQIQFKIFHSTEKQGEKGEARPQRPSRLRSSCEKRPKKRKEEKEESKNN